jgi:DeoR/GlpR family transcriptional regulator of sugar metabolism
MRMLTEERRRRLLEAVNARGSLTVGEAEKAFDVSRMTIHRDLETLAAEGVVRKVHGGVMALDRGNVDPRARPFDERSSLNRDAKRSIAERVVKLMGNAHTAILDASTTVFCMAAPLRAGARELFVVTGGLRLFNELGRPAPGRGHGGVRVALHGGEPHPRTGPRVGPLARASLGELRFDYAGVSALGVLDDGGVFISSPEEVEVKRAYLARSGRKVLAVDTSKLGLTGAYKLGPLGDFDYVVTEKGVYAPGELPTGRRRRR